MKSVLLMLRAASKDVPFKLHAPGQTTVACVYAGEVRNSHGHARVPRKDEDLPEAHR